MSHKIPFKAYLVKHRFRTAGFVDSAVNLVVREREPAYASVILHMHPGSTDTPGRR
jgi:hypothetical protein